MGVIVLPELPGPEPPGAASASSQCPIMPVWCCTVVYDEDMGLRQAPICGPSGATSRFNRVHGGKCVKIIKWLAVGWGAKPPLPSWDTGQQNEVLLRRVRGLPVPGKAIDGADVVIYYGEYYYGLQVPLDDNDPLTGAAAPYQSSPSVTAIVLTQGDFNNIFTGPSQQPGAGNGILINY